MNNTVLFAAIVIVLCSLRYTKSTHNKTQIIPDSTEYLYLMRKTDFQDSIMIVAKRDTSVGIKLIFFLIHDGDKKFIGEEQNGLFSDHLFSFQFNGRKDSIIIHDSCFAFLSPYPGFENIALHMFKISENARIVNLGLIQGSEFRVNNNKLIFKIKDISRSNSTIAKPSKRIIGLDTLFNVHW